MIRCTPARSARFALSLLGACLFAREPSTFAADAPPSGAQALTELAATIRSRPAAERIDVVLRSGGVERKESITLATRPPADARLEFGPYVVWVTERFVRVIHEQDMKGFFEVPVVSGGALEALDSLFPPLPVPQLALFLTPPGQPIELTAYCRNVSWTASAPVATAKGVRQEWTGRGPRVQARLETLDGRVARFTIRADDEQEIEVTSTPLPDVKIDQTMESELGRRRQVAALIDLQPRPGDSGVGSPLPPLTLTNSDIEAGSATPTGPCAILFFDRLDEGVEMAHDALQIVHKKRPTVAVWNTLVTDVFESRLSFRIDEARQQLAPDPIYYTVSPASTIERFTEASRSALVVVDDQSIVRAVLPMPGLSAVGRAAQVDRLAERVLDALRPQPQSP